MLQFNATFLTLYACYINYIIVRNELVKRVVENEINYTVKTDVVVARSVRKDL